MIVPPLVQAAIELLEQEGPPTISREKVEAFARLCAWDHHFPSQSTPENKRLIESSQWIAEREFSRYLKQRRLAISQICHELRKKEESST